MNLISSLESPLVLSHPWLSFHNPHINWETGSVCHWRTKCHLTCLRSTLLTSEIKKEETTIPEFSSAPHKYYDLAGAFWTWQVQSSFSSLLPSSCFHNPSEPEKIVMEKCISASLNFGMHLLPH